MIKGIYITLVLKQQNIEAVGRILTLLQYVPINSMQIITATKLVTPLHKANVELIVRSIC